VIVAFVIPGCPEGAGPEPMNTDSEKTGSDVRKMLEKTVFLGSGFAAVQRPGMTI
jgi:hypothetical protein